MKKLWIDKCNWVSNECLKEWSEISEQVEKIIQPTKKSDSVQYQLVWFCDVQLWYINYLQIAGEVKGQTLL